MLNTISTHQLLLQDALFQLCLIFTVALLPQSVHWEVLYMEEQTKLLWNFSNLFLQFNNQTKCLNPNGKTSNLWWDSDIEFTKSKIQEVISLKIIQLSFQKNLMVNLYWFKFPKISKREWSQKRKFTPTLISSQQVHITNAESERNIFY